MPKKSRLRLYLSSLRLERWPRSLAVLPGLVMAYLLIPTETRPAVDFYLAAKGVLGFMLAWAVSTINYIINEITDAPFDAHHPTKRHRPLVMREISRSILTVIGLGLGILSAVLSILVFDWRFNAALLLLLVQGTLYNIKPFRLKDTPYVDATLESANNPIRFFIGWFVLSTSCPPLSLLVSWWAFGNFLMIGKRVAEKKFLTRGQADAYRRSLKKYSLKGLIVFMAANALIFLSTYVWFALEFRKLILLFMLPGVIAYLIIFLYISIRTRDTAEEPEKLLKNPFFALFTLALVALIILAFLPSP